MTGSGCTNAVASRYASVLASVMFRCASGDHLVPSRPVISAMMRSHRHGEHGPIRFRGNRLGAAFARRADELGRLRVEISELLISTLDDLDRLSDDELGRLFAVAAITESLDAAVAALAGERDQPNRRG